jgi:superfamily II DNA helicase RecQ
VFFIGPPDDALELVQGMGRAGREGTKRSICQILLDADWKVPDINTDGQFMDTNQRTISYCLDGGRCRKQALSQYMDGVSYTCESNTIGRSAEGAPYVPCDYCLNRPARQLSLPAAEALPADDQAAILDLQAPIVAVPEVERLQVHVRDRARAREEFLQGLRALHG